MRGLAASAPGTPIALDDPDANAPAGHLMDRLGLRPTFLCARMHTGPRPDADMAGLFAVASIELG